MSIHQPGMSIHPPSMSIHHVNSPTGHVNSPIVNCVVAQRATFAARGFQDKRREQEGNTLSIHPPGASFCSFCFHFFSFASVPFLLLSFQSSATEITSECTTSPYLRANGLPVRELYGAIPAVVRHRRPPSEVVLSSGRLREGDPSELEHPIAQRHAAHCATCSTQK